MPRRCCVFDKYLEVLIKLRAINCDEISALYRGSWRKDLLT